MTLTNCRLAGATFVALLLSACLHPVGPIHTPSRDKIKLPNRPDSIRFAVIGDSGEVGEAQSAIAGLLTKYHELFPFEFVVMVGDNTYAPSQTMTREFEIPFKALLDKRVQFYASLGNHDDNADVQTRYAPFNMNGQEYYAFDKGPVHFFALNSNKPDRAQLRWIDSNLAKPVTGWKIAFFHHPLYSSGFHAQPLTGGKEQKSLRAVWEPRLCAYGVDVVFSGHEHFYERITPQQGVQHFVNGASSKLRWKDVSKRPTESHTASKNDVDYSFMLVEISQDQMHYQTMSVTGNNESGVVQKSQTRPSCAAIVQ